MVDQRHPTAVAVRRLEAFSRDGVPLQEPAELGGGVVLVKHVARIQEHGHANVRLGQRGHQPAQSAIDGGSLLVQADECDPLGCVSLHAVLRFFERRARNCREKA